MIFTGNEGNYIFNVLIDPRDKITNYFKLLKDKIEKFHIIYSSYKKIIEGI